MSETEKGFRDKKVRKIKSEIDCNKNETADDDHFVGREIKF